MDPSSLLSAAARCFSASASEYALAAALRRTLTLTQCNGVWGRRAGSTSIRAAGASEDFCHHPRPDRRGTSDRSVNVLVSGSTFIGIGANSSRLLFSSAARTRPSWAYGWPGSFSSSTTFAHAFGEPRRYYSSKSSPSSTSSGGFETIDPESVSYIRDPSSNTEIFLIGTAHVSEKSAEDVVKLIELVRPDFVFVELCDTRAQRLRAAMRGDEKKKNEDDDEGWNKIFEGLLKGKNEGGSSSSAGGGATKVIRELMSRLLGGGGGGQGGAGKQFDTMLKSVLKSSQALFKKQYGLQPGGEFKRALETADRLRRDYIASYRLKIPVVLGDRDVNETVSKLRGAIFRTNWFKVATTTPSKEVQDIFGGPANASISGLFSGEKSEVVEKIEKMKNRKHIRQLRGYMEGVLPEVMEVMLHSRDEMMADGIREKCKGARRVVAVVGMAHMDGIEERLGNVSSGKKK